MPRDADTPDGTDDAGALDAHDIQPAAPAEFGRTQVWWGDGKGKTTAALGMGFRAAGHGYRVHLLQFMKGGAASVEDVRGEYNAINAVPGFTYEHSGHYGWHAMNDGTDDVDHEARAQGGLERARELIDAAHDADLTEPLDLEAPADDGVHMLVLDELCYAANRDLVAPDAVADLVESKPDALELVLTGGHDDPTYVTERADLVTNVKKQRHPFDDGVRARKGTEF
ncbi:cob(I)yrinic acid a,c-diamide adenosyltransferase [Halorubellus litoreus]|uniref:Cob(I)yrinic acid a,c-diamide adenosyltransferase n=1 Tax=Halorubellus litoreus TaxID=755308 RepID=A0ABD5VF20_9EURY